MKQIVDKLNKIAKKIDESVEIPQTDLIIDSLDAITKAYGGTPNDSHLIVDKLEDIAGVAHSGITPSGNIEITENTAEGSPLNIAQYATATVNVSGGGTYTETFELTKDTTATATEDGGEYYIGLIVGNDFYIVPSFDITVNVNDTDISMIHNPGGYWEDNTDNPTYILYLSNNPALMVPAAGNYTVKSISATITGTSLVNCKTTGQHELAFYFTDNNDALYYFYNGAHTVDVDVPIKSITKSQ